MSDWTAEDSDELARLIVATTDDPGAARALAAAFGEGDVIARHLPTSVVPALVRAAWTQICAMEATAHQHPSARTLRWAATTLLLDVAGEMEPLVTIAAPDTPQDAHRHA